jgi:HEPN domain-containing protein
MPDTTHASFTELDSMLEIASYKYQRVFYSLHSAGRVREALSEGHVFYSLNCIPDNLLYDDKLMELPVITREELQKIKNDAQANFSLWLEKSHCFYESSVFLHQNHPSPLILFYLHQAVEMIYRGVLKSIICYDKKSHTIRNLQKLYGRFAKQLNIIFPDNTDEEKRLLEILEKGYLEARYEAFAIDENDLLILFEKVKLLLSTANEIVEKIFVGHLSYEQ